MGFEIGKFEIGNFEISNFKIGTFEILAKCEFQNVNIFFHYMIMKTKYRLLKLHIYVFNEPISLKNAFVSVTLFMNAP